MKLVYEKTGHEVGIGDEVTMRDGEKVTVAFFRRPHKAGSSGHVSVQYPNGGQREYYVGSIGAKWIEREDRGWKPGDPPDGVPEPEDDPEQQEWVISGTPNVAPEGSIAITGPGGTVVGYIVPCGGFDPMTKPVKGSK